MLHKNLLILLEVFLFSFSVSAQQDSLARFILQGEVLSGFGHQVCSGDFNGDNIDDIVITSALRNVDSPLKILFYWGSTSMDTTVDLVIYSDTVYAGYYEYDICNANDINGDGFDDLLVGFYGSMNYTGRSFVYFGGNPMNTNADLIMNGFKPYSGFGNEVSPAGDVNGDGFSDFIVSAALDAYFQTDTSKVFLYLGGINPDINPDLVIISHNIDDYFGNSLATVGDINLDGFDDFAIGFKQGSDKVFIYCGSQQLDDSVDFFLQNYQPVSDFGFSICGNTDLNRDGYSDILIGAPKFDIAVGEYSYGRVYVYFGSESFDSVPDLIFTGDKRLARFGYAISNIGFFNEDEYPDLIIGAPGDNYEYGKAFIFFGSEEWNVAPDIVMIGEFEALFAFGGTISTCDFNNDHLNEILFGSKQCPPWLETKELIWPDQVYLYYFVPPAYKIRYSATNFIFEEPNSFTFDVYIKNNGNYPWQYRNGQLTFTFNSSILRYGSLVWSIVPGFSDFPIEQQPDSAVVYNSSTIGTMSTDPVEGYNFIPGEELRYGRFRIQTTDTNFTTQPHNLRFIRNGTNKTQSSRWVWYDSTGRVFNSENISFIDLGYELLPVELTSFSASINQSKVQLNWETASELNNSGFEVQRKLEKSDWITIGFIQGNGTTTEPTLYTYLDNIGGSISRKIYYRIKQIDYNGNYEFSYEIEIMTLPQEYSLSQNYPNPFNPSTTIEYQIPQSSFVIIKVYDALGKEVVTLVNEDKPAGVHEVNFVPKDLTSGLYLYKIKAGSFEQTRKMIFLK